MQPIYNADDPLDALGRLPHIDPAAGWESRVLDGLRAKQAEKNYASPAAFKIVAIASLIVFMNGAACFAVLRNHSRTKSLIALQKVTDTSNTDLGLSY